MKHIQEILSEKRMSLFAEPQEKGSGEWSTFDAVKDSRGGVGAYRVSVPRQAIVVREPHHVLRIVYPLRHLRLAH